MIIKENWRYKQKLDATVSLENIFTICSYLLEGNLIQLRNYGTIDTNKICIE